MMFEFDVEYLRLSGDGPNDEKRARESGQPPLQAGEG
jgi:hypothetical protein